jgi:uncharacterized protein (DUF849 family)
MAEVTEQIVREAPDIEAYKIGLLQSAKALADQGVTIPPQLVADMSASKLAPRNSQHRVLAVISRI